MKYRSFWHTVWNVLTGVSLFAIFGGLVLFSGETVALVTVAAYLIAYGFAGLFLFGFLACVTDPFAV